MNKTKIPWTERTWNPVTGCSKFSAGCLNCYAETMAKRLCAMGEKKYRNGFGVTLHPESLDEPIKLKGRNMIFVCSMSDLFHGVVPYEFIDKVMDVIERTPYNTYQLLTKRADVMENYLYTRLLQGKKILDNVWAGVTVEDKKAKDRIKYLKRVPARIKFLSCEPLLEDLGEIDLDGIDWVIVGGESGPNGRPMKKDWVLSIKKQCENQGIRFFFKQWGTWGEDGVKRNKKANGCLLDGIIYNGMPRIDAGQNWIAE